MHDATRDACINPTRSFMQRPAQKVQAKPTRAVRSSSVQWLPSLVWTGVLVLALIAWRWPFLAHPARTMDSDEAITGLMALDILDGARPLYYYGQGYLGTTEPFTAAGVFALLGATPLALRIAPLLLFALSLPVQLLVVSRWFGRSAAWWSVLFMALLPAPAALWTVKARGGFTAVFLMGMVLVWTCQRAADSAGVRRRIWGFVSGAALGLGWWTNPMIVFYVVPLAGLVIRRLNGVGPIGLRHCVAFTLPTTLGLLLGLTPVWIYRLAPASLVSRQLFDPDPHAWLAGLTLLARSILPLLFDLSVATLGLIAVLLAVWTAYSMTRSCRCTAVRRGEGPIFVALMVAAVPLIALLSNQLADVHSFRYLLPIYVPLSIALGKLCSSGLTVTGWHRVAALGLAVVWAGHCGHSMWRHRHDRIEPIPAQDILYAAQNAGVDALAAPYWQAYRLSFLTGRRLLTVPVDGISRDPLGLAQWNRSSNRALIWPTDRLGDMTGLRSRTASAMSVGRWSVVPITLSDSSEGAADGQQLLDILRQDLPEHEPPRSAWPALQ
ncbi:MAG: ArnT family glycosyltransferase [Phycisphaerae bacterium]